MNEKFNVSLPSAAASKSLLSFFLVFEGLDEVADRKPITAFSSGVGILKFIFLGG